MPENRLNDPTMSVPEAGRLLGVGRSAAYEAAARGQIPALRIGRLLRVPRVALQNMLDSCARASGQGAA
jgi:excisionase family DNA binding protein